MKILIIGNRDRYEKYSGEALSSPGYETVFFPRGTSDGDLARGGAGAEIILADAIAPVGAALIDHFPALKMIHSEGVAFDKIDLGRAGERGIFVCNNRGCNAKAVAEQAVLLMLAWLRDAVSGDAAVRAGRQIETKERKMVEGISELGEKTVGLIGFGDIAKETAKLLAAFGCDIYYYSPHRKSAEEEARYGVKYADPETLAGKSDIVSVHAAVTPESTGMIGAAFISKMKKSAFVVNTARGEIVDNAALREALIAGTIAGAAFDCLHPEPTPADHPLVKLPESCAARVIYAPHLGGITTGSFRRAHKNMWENVARVFRGERPVNTVN